MTYSIGDYRLDPLRRELRTGHALRRLEPQVFDTLLFLIENRHRVVSRGDLIAAVWNGRSVTDASVDSRISAARKAIGDDGRSQRVIRTVSRRGFHFVADVEVMDGGMGDVSLEGDKACVAVLPFRDLARDHELGHFIEGMVGDLTADLSRFPSLRVVSRSVTARYGQEPIDLRRMSRELGVQYAVEGSVEETGERLRLTVQLAEASSGTQLWAQRFDIDRVDLTGVRDEIRMIIVGSLTGEGGPVTRAEQQRAMRKSSDVLTAHDLLWRAEGKGNEGVMIKLVGQVSHQYQIERAAPVPAESAFSRATGRTACQPTAVICAPTTTRAIAMMDQARHRPCLVACPGCH